MKNLLLRLLALPLLLLTFQPVSAAWGGPDAYGYWWQDSVPYNWIEIKGIGTQIVGFADDNSVMAPTLSSPVGFYGAYYNQIKVGSNGWLSFENIGNIAHCFPTIPTAGGAGDNYLAAFMCDLIFSGSTNPGSVWWLDMGDSLVITYDSVPFWTPTSPSIPLDYTGSVSFQIIMDRFTNSITVQYKNYIPADSVILGCTSKAVVGIEDSTGTTGLMYASTYVPYAGAAIRFGPLGYAANRVSGLLYRDADMSGTFNAGDVPLPGQPVSAGPGHVVYSDTAGIYTVYSPTTTVIVMPVTLAIYTYSSVVPSFYSITLPSSPYDSTGNNFGYRGIVFVPDMGVQLNTFPPCVGQPYTYWVAARNWGGIPNSDTLWTVVDDEIHSVTSTPPADRISGDTLFWKYDPVYPLMGWGAVISGIVDSTAVPGTNAVFVGFVEPLSPDLYIPNNSDTNTLAFTASFDPNSKWVQQGAEIMLDDVTAGEQLNYTIHFQNLGTATAYNVEILDTLDADLDPATFMMQAASHDYTVSITGNVIKWRFDGIMLPDSASDPFGSKGFVNFTLGFAPGYAVGTEVHNDASIYFDWNPAVITNTTVTTVATVVGLTPQMESRFSVSPNPTSGILHLSTLQGQLASVRVQSLSGQQIMTQDLQGTTQDMDLGTLPPGVYLLWLSDDQGHAAVYKIVMQ